VPPADAPMDFAGWFEAYLGGRWSPSTLAINTPRIGRILIARGRDAADVAISTRRTQHPGGLFACGPPKSCTAG